MNLIQNNFAKIISINNQHLLIVDKKFDNKILSI
jgi:hypothetical protein